MHTYQIRTICVFISLSTINMAEIRKAKEPKLRFDSSADMLSQFGIIRAFSS